MVSGVGSVNAAGVDGLSVQVVASKSNSRQPNPPIRSRKPHTKMAARRDRFRWQCVERLGEDWLGEGSTRFVVLDTCLGASTVRI